MARRTQVVCLGGGWAAVGLSQGLREAIDAGAVELTVISRDNFHTYNELMPEMLSGRIEPSQIVSPARRIFRRAQFHNAEIERVDVEAKTVTTTRSLDGREYIVPYDHLVIGVGSVDDLSRYHGIAEHAHRLKSYADCFALRNHILKMLEMAEFEADIAERQRLLTFVVGGGNYAGIEVATELVDFLHRLAEREYPGIRRSEIRVVVAHGGDVILPELNAQYPELVRYAERYLGSLSSEGLEIRVKTYISAATPEEVIFANGDRVQTRTLISATGIAQSPLLNSLPFERDPRGRVVTDEMVRVKETDNVWAAGDCAAVPRSEGGTCPPLATYARAAGAHIGRNISHVVAGGPPTPFEATDVPDAATLGRHTGVAQFRGVKLTGVPAWLFWRGLLLRRTPTWDRKVRLLFDWLVGPILGRDIVSMQVNKEPGIQYAVYEPGQIIIKQGDVGRSLYVIRSGEVEVLREGRDGEPAEIFGTLGPGEHFGETAVFQNVRRTATVRAKTEVQLLVLEREEAFSLSSALQSFGEEIKERPHAAPETEELPVSSSPVLDPHPPGSLSRDAGEEANR